MSKLAWKGINIEIERTADGGHAATAAIPTKGGGVFVYRTTARIPPAIYAYLASIAPEAAAGGFFEDIQKEFSKITKSQAYADVTKIVADVAENPVVADFLKTYLGESGTKAIGSGARHAHSLAARAKKRDPKAVRAVGDIARAAKAGNPKAVRAAAMIREAARQQRASGPRLDQQQPSAPSLGDLASFVAQPTDAAAYAAMVQRYAGGQVLNTALGPDGSYQVTAGASDVQPKCGPATNPFCGCVGCPAAFQHVHATCPPVGAAVAGCAL